MVIIILLIYCISNNLKQSNIIWNNKKYITNDVVDNLFNSTLEFNISNNTLSPTPHQNWNDIRKTFKINKKISYTDKTNTKFVVNICKQNDNNESFYSLKNSGIIKSYQRYEFYIDITNTSKENILPAIIKMEQAIYLSTFILTKPQTKKNYR